MDYITKFRRQLASRVFFSILVPIIITVICWLFLTEAFSLATWVIFTISGFIALFSAYLSTVVLVAMSTEPIEVLQDVISYASHNNRDGHLPNPEQLSLGRELVTAQSLQIYNLASSVHQNLDKTGANIDAAVSSAPNHNLLDLIGLPVVGIDENLAITVINRAAFDYIEKPDGEIVGKSIDDVFSLSFQGDETLSNWLEEVKKSSVTATHSWDRVRHNIDEDNSKQFDLSASFSSGNQSGTETMLAFFDRTEKYYHDDQEISFVAMAVHELRTPVTIMRGYIEVFEDELGPTLSPELVSFMHRMHASSQQLTAFVNNILNVARIDENQLQLKLRSENWSEILTTAVEDLRLRAKVHDIDIELAIAEGLPPVGVDRVGIHEVINNLVDNAIKYSGTSNKISITSKLNTEGLVETSVQDYGIGIPDSVMNRLFQKFHRSHKSSNQIGGTGLGLFLCKSLISAQSGNFWVRSKEGEGSIFTFTVLPFDQISKEQLDGEDGIIRGAHGWIKNHSLYRN